MSNSAVDQDKDQDDYIHMDPVVVLDMVDHCVGTEATLNCVPLPIVSIKLTCTWPP